MNLPIDLKVLLRRNVDLAQATTMQVGGPANYFAEPASEEELFELLDFARNETLPWMILGRGSNVIFPDEGYPGLIISLLQYEKDKIVFDSKLLQVTVSGGVSLSRLVAALRDAGFGGAEFLAGIPGTVGGALVMNAGFSRFVKQFNEIGDFTEEVTIINDQGKKEVRSKKDLEFSYRKSNLEGCVVLEARLQLWKRDRSEIEKEIRLSHDYRNAKQDLRYPSSGSIFKNPPVPFPSAGCLIDQLGLKGTQIGGVMVSPKHGNYFIKVGPAKSSDVRQLIEKIQTSVFNATQIFLEPEVRVIEKP